VTPGHHLPSLLEELRAQGRRGLRFAVKLSLQKALGIGAAVPVKSYLISESSFGFEKFGFPAIQLKSGFVTALSTLW